MRQSSYAARVLAQRSDLLKIGFGMGLEWAQDMFILTLRDPKAMGKDTFGYRRIRRILDRSAELAGEYWPAMTGGTEADYYQAKVDEAMKEFVPDDDFTPFAERYPYLKEECYTRLFRGFGKRKDA